MSYITTVQASVKETRDTSEDNNVVYQKVLSEAQYSKARNFCRNLAIRKKNSNFSNFL